jgi:aryl-alcohol dehydrogenase-like predicted oxidoreductase
MRALSEFARARDLTLSQLALAWLLHQPAMSAPIIGASRPEQVRENAKASGVKLSPDEMAEIETILKGPEGAAK